MTVERTTFRLMILGLVLVCLAQAGSTVRQVALALPAIDMGAATFAFFSMLALRSLGLLLLSLAALVFVPRIVRKLVPEVG